MYHQILDFSLTATEQFNVAASLGEPTNNRIAAD